MQEDWNPINNCEIFPHNSVMKPRLLLKFELICGFQD